MEVCDFGSLFPFKIYLFRIPAALPRPFPPSSHEGESEPLSECARLENALPQFARLNNGPQQTLILRFLNGSVTFTLLNVDTMLPTNPSALRRVRVPRMILLY